MVQPIVQLPPYPAQATPGDYIWVDWWKKLQDYMKSITASAQYTDLGNGTTSKPGWSAWIDDGTGTLAEYPVGGYCYIQGDLVSFLLFILNVPSNQTGAKQGYIQTADPFLIMPDNNAFLCTLGNTPLNNAVGIGVTTALPVINIPYWGTSTGKFIVHGSYIPLVTG